MTPQQAMVRLRDGNRRFLRGGRGRDIDSDHLRRRELIGGQTPYAVILCCSDSRAPPELLFDQGFGDLFVVRIAGNVAGISQIGSIEFAVERLGAPLVVVLGHSGCSAVLTTLEETLEPSSVPPPYLESVTGRIHGAVAGLIQGRRGQGAKDMLADAVEANIRASVRTVLDQSNLLSERIARGAVAVVGAQYFLESGAVRFFD